MEVPVAWLKVLTVDDVATACQNANHAALPKKAHKEDWVSHATGHILLHQVGIHGLEKLCKHEKVADYKGKTQAQLIKLLQRQSAETAVQPDVLAAFEQLNIKAEKGNSLVSTERLSALAPQRLQDLCRARVLSSNGSKADLLQSLQRDNITLEELSKSELKALCIAEGLPVSGTCAALRLRLQAPQGQASKPGPSQPKQKAVVEQQIAQEAAVVQQGDLLQAGKKMNRTQYANILRREGLLEADQDVFHIIASANGGADHTHNYHFAQNQSWNRAIGSQHDFINCYIAGKIKAEKAVAISRAIGNGSITYTGPDALTLYKMGEDIMRTMRREHRHDWVNLMQARG